MICNSLKLDLACGKSKKMALPVLISGQAQILLSIWKNSHGLFQMTALMKFSALTIWNTLLI